MATSIQSKTLSPFPGRARVAGSVCALALAATGLVGLGIKADAGYSKATVPVRQAVRSRCKDVCRNGTEPTPIQLPRRDAG